MANKSLKQTLDDLIDQFSPEIRDAFYAAIQDVVDNAILGSMIDAIKQGDVDAAFRAVGFTPAAMRPITAMIERAFETGGEQTGDTFPKVLNTPNGKAVFRFDVRNVRAETWLRDNSASLVQNLTDEARTVVRNVMTQGMTDGRNPRAVALDIVGKVDQTTGQRVGGSIGLTVNQEGWVRSARNKLENLDNSYFNMELRDKRFDGTVAKAINSGTPLPPATVDKLIDRYRSNALKYRGTAIARTEAIASLNRSEYEALLQAVDSGAVDASAVTRIWDSAGDNRVRPAHRAMDGQKVGLLEAFKAPDGSKLMFPGDSSLGARAADVVNCRCRARLKVDWLAGLD